jgi:hypothetical protein
MHYILFVYDYDSNAILMEPVMNRQAATLRAAMERSALIKGGCRPQFHRWTMSAQGHAA